MSEIKKILVDSPEYKQIEQYLFFKSEKTLDLLETFCHHDDVSIYASLNDGTVNGFCVTGTCTGDVIQLLFIGVHPKSHKSGVATALLNAAIEDQKPKAVVAEIPENSLGFFKNFGFYTMEFGEDLLGKNVYYGTYRCVK